MKQMIKRKLFCSLLLITLLVSGVILFQPRPVLAASKTYEINISKTSASAAEKKLRKISASDTRQLRLSVNAKDKKDAEKKLRKISASDTRQLRLTVKAKDKKDAEKKLQAWLLKFQNLAANKFGTLSCKYNTTFIDAHPSLKGYYCLKYTGYCSDYVNII